MRPADQDPTATLEALDATLAGDPVDPEYAEVAELALLLRAERPAPPADFAARLDGRVTCRFAADAQARRAPAGWLFAPAAGRAGAIVVAVIVLASSGGGGPRIVASSASGRSLPAARPTTAVGLAPERVLPRRTASEPAPASTSALAPSATPAPIVQPPFTGRKIVQSSQLSLSAPGNRIDDVAQEVFNVVGAVHGYVNNSNVTATSGPDGYAQFQLTVPSQALPYTMAQLSELRYASVVSRTDLTNDVTDQFTSASSQLAQAQALRTSLLKQLQNAVTQSQIYAIRAQLADADAKIASAQATLRTLNRQVSESQISVTVNARAVPVSRHSGGFTIGKATDDAGRVLEVAAGVALIALAVLAPLGLVGLLVWWIAAALRRRGREQALDLA
jgi:hypothetical protein